LGQTPRLLDLGVVPGERRRGDQPGNSDQHFGGTPGLRPVADRTVRRFGGVEISKLIRP